MPFWKLDCGQLQPPDLLPPADKSLHRVHDSFDGQLLVLQLWHPCMWPKGWQSLPNLRACMQASIALCVLFSGGQWLLPALASYSIVPVLLALQNALPSISPTNCPQYSNLVEEDLIDVIDVERRTRRHLPICIMHTHTARDHRQQEELVLGGAGRCSSGSHTANRLCSPAW